MRLNRFANTLHGGPASLGNISADLSQLANVVQGGQALAYSLAGQAAVFRRTFPGYQSAIGLPPALGTYQSNYARWAQTSLATNPGNSSRRWTSGQIARD